MITREEALELSIRAGIDLSDKHKYTEFQRWAAELLLVELATLAYQRGLEDAARACDTATPDANARRAIGDAAHYAACSNAIRALGEKK